jgi:hypothetical protein
VDMVDPNNRSTNYRKVKPILANIQNSIFKSWESYLPI